MNKFIFKNCLIVLMLMFSTQTVFAESNLYKLNGFRAESIVLDPSAQVENYVIYSDNNKEIVDYTHKIFYLNGGLVPNTEILLINGMSYINISAFDNMPEFSVYVNNNGTVSINKGKNLVLVNDIKTVKNTLYIPLRSTFENLKMNVAYFGITDTNSTSLVPTRVSVYVDDKYTHYEDVESALLNSKKVCLKGLENYKNEIIKNNNRLEFNKEFDDEFLLIEKSINEMSYIGEVSRYYVFDMNLYRVVYDKISGEMYFDYNTGLCTYIKYIDVNSSDLFTPLFLIG